MNRDLIHLLYVSPEQGKQWPSWKDWLYALLFVCVFFGIVPFVGWIAGM